MGVQSGRLHSIQGSYERITGSNVQTNLFSTKQLWLWNQLRLSSLHKQNQIIHFTARKRSLRRLCFHKRLLFCPQWECLHLGGLHPGGICIQRGSASRVCIRGVGQTPPSPRILRDTVNERAVRILMECILVTHISYYMA